MESRGQGYKKIRECRGQGQKWQCQVEIMERCVIESEVKERKGYLEQRSRKEKVMKSRGQGKKKLAEGSERRFFNNSELTV